MGARKNEKAQVKIVITDSFNKSHSAKFQIPFLPLNKALKYNALFGQSKESELKTQQNNENNL